MEGEEEGGLKLSKRIAKGEVDYANKSGTAWSHSYLNQKPWHPLSYPNQKRKWIAEQTHAQKELRAQEVAREFAQEQEFFRQTAAIAKKEKEKVELMKAVSFMYVRPPGYNAESAKAAEIAEENRKSGITSEGNDNVKNEEADVKEKKKRRPKDLYGRPLPTEEEFEVLKNAPRLETGVIARAKPFAVEIRNVKCLRCGTFGHQSGDRECPLKDVIMPNEESRLKRDDPLTTMMANSAYDEPLKWELKQQPGGISPPRGGFNLDDPNQQIIAEDIFDEYGGFLNGADIPDLLMSFKERNSMEPKSKKKKRKHKTSNDLTMESGDRHHKKYLKDDNERRTKAKERKRHSKYHDDSFSSESESSGFHREKKKAKETHASSSDSSELSNERKERQNIKARKSSLHQMSESSESEPSHREKKHHSRRKEHRRKEHRRLLSDVSGSSDSESSHKRKHRRHKRKKHRKSSSTSESSDVEASQKRGKDKHKRKRHKKLLESASEASDAEPSNRRGE